MLIPVTRPTHKITKTTAAVTVRMRRRGGGGGGFHDDLSIAGLRVALIWRWLRSSSSRAHSESRRTETRLERNADTLACAASVAPVGYDDGVRAIHLNGVVGAGIKAVAASAVAIGEALALVDDGDAENGVFDRRFFGKLQCFCGAYFYAQWHPAVFFGTKIAPVRIEIERWRAHPQKTVFDAGGFDNLARACFVAALAADACGDELCFVLASRREA